VFGAGDNIIQGEDKVFPHIHCDCGRSAIVDHNLSHNPKLFPEGMIVESTIADWPHMGQHSL
jgi:hypothetical protein